MTKYKVNINPTPPSDDEIAEYKDFGKVLNDYKRVHQPWWVLKNFHKNRRLRHIIILLFIVLIALYFSSKHFKKEEEKIKKEQSKQSSYNVTTPNNILDSSMNYLIL